ncbi:MAG: HAD-IIB family hydrolase [Oscillospiraceae bacterium]|jgi:Cof subfamily protein (haloacid dehalogenase superfamily)|nr:HAD-IIB family hydrolase [Oscillospiraceae bacterium]
MPNIELWDAYDAQRRPTGRTIPRGPMPAGDYPVVVHIWLQQSAGDFFITQRSPAKGLAPLLWETTGGSALAGEDSLTAALREAREETGFALLPENGFVWRSYKREYGDGGDFVDVWLFRQDVRLADFAPQPGETIAAQFASPAQILTMAQAGQFFKNSYAEELFAFAAQGAQQRRESVMPIQMIVTDLDRTLLHTDKSISDYTVQVLRRCRAAGIKIVFATARPLRGALPYTDAAEKPAGAPWASTLETDALVLHNGALLLADGEICAEHRIPVQDARRILLQVLRQHPGATLSTEIAGHMYVNFDLPAVPFEPRSFVRSDFTDLPDEPAYNVVVGGVAQNDLAALAGLTTEEMYFQMLTGQQNVLGFFMHRAATKANGVGYFAARFGIPAANIAAFGDDHNDIAMLQSCGTGVAVANALEEAKAAAKCTCGSNDEDGVAEWLERNVL